MKMYSIIMFLAACMLSLTSCDKENNAIITNEIQTKANIFDDFPKFPAIYFLKQHNSRAIFK